METLRHLTIKKFHRGLLNKEFSAFEAVKSFFNYIGEKDKEIDAYLSLDKDGALAAAERVDVSLASGAKMDVLAGVPMAIKDNILIEGMPATAASKVLKDYVAAYDATVINKLKAKQAIFLGKTNLDEFAMGSSTENSAFKVTKNPHDTTRVPGGSSGGSAAAVASHMALAALGSDTGGSIRQPAAFCGVVGLKPTYGAVSRSGLIAMCSSLDQIGPLTTTVEDAAILFSSIAGHDPLDATSVHYAYDDLANPKLETIKKLCVGIPEEYFGEGISEEVRSGVEDAIKKIKGLGLQFKKISLPHTKYALSTYYIVMPAEVSSNLGRFDGIRYCRTAQTNADDTQKNAEKGQRESVSSQRTSALSEIYFRQRGMGFGTETKRRIILGTVVLSSGYYDAYYEKAQRVRRLMKNDFESAFKEVDVMLTPVTPTPGSEEHT